MGQSWLRQEQLVPRHGDDAGTGRLESRRNRTWKRIVAQLISEKEDPF